MFDTSLAEADNLFVIAMVYGAVVVVAFWLAMVIWTYRDMRARSRDSLAQLFVTLMVALLTLPGFLIYIFLRPRETLSEAYERSLEEEALLQEIEEKPSCPGCGQRVQLDWQACPNCHTRLKKTCLSCQSLLELSWNLCPYCASNQGTYVDTPTDMTTYSDTMSTPQISLQRQHQVATSEHTVESLEFVEGEDF